MPAHPAFPIPARDSFVNASTRSAIYDYSRSPPRFTALVGSAFQTRNSGFRGFRGVKSGRRERELRASLLRSMKLTVIFLNRLYRLTTKTLKACSLTFCKIDNCASHGELTVSRRISPRNRRGNYLLITKLVDQKVRLHRISER